LVYVIFVVLLSLLSVYPSELKAESSERILVFAAASLTDVLQEIGTRYTEASDHAVSFSFAGSSTLARQIDQGAPADVYISANQAWMDYLQERGRLATDGPQLFAKGNLVAISPVGVTVSIKIDAGFPFGRAFSGRLAIADPAHVPAGEYARQTLKALGWWDQVSGRLAIGSDVRGALAYVEREACDLGIVYETDARISDRVKVVATFSDSLHAPIRYLAAVVGSFSNSSANDFVRFLSSENAEPILINAGFRVSSEEQVRAR
jgi:molybdate transport system substrate-binding protein